MLPAFRPGDGAQDCNAPQNAGQEERATDRTPPTTAQAAPSSPHKHREEDHGDNGSPRPFDQRVARVRGQDAYQSDRDCEGQYGRPDVVHLIALPT